MDIAEQLARGRDVQRVPSPRLALFIRRRFLAPEDCRALIARIEAQRRPSTLADDIGDTTFRTSETCDLSSDDPAVGTVEERIAALTGLDLAHGEPIQGQRYSAGQEFKTHTDYFEPGGTDFERYCAIAGQRTWTVMIYLNEPEAGGATRFKHVDKIVRPEPGKLLAWNNLNPDGSVNPWTLHHGMKVRRGTKYIVTKWFREREWG